MVAGEARQDTPSRSAYGVALLRAQHQVAEGGSIFPDPLAIPITGANPENLARRAEQFPHLAVFRNYIATRSRFAEDCLAKAVDRGVRQIVSLGAGLDTFGLRNPYAERGVRVFEVDRPATQMWKRRCLTKANLPIPPSLTFVAVDFENGSFLKPLASSGFKMREPAFFIWLGVVSYLSRKAIAATLTTIATVPDAEIVFDYGEPLASIPPQGRAGYKSVIARMSAAGEPWVSFFTPAEIASGLPKLGFSDIEDLGSGELDARYPGVGSPTGAHLVRACVKPGRGRSRFSSPRPFHRFSMGPGRGGPKNARRQPDEP